MAVWGQLILQEGARSIAELLIYFHDYIIIILTLILMFVTYLFIYTIVVSKVDKYTIDSHVLETV